MRLTVVGCAGSYARPDSTASCYLVEHDGFRVVLDMGNGSLGALARHTDLVDGIDAVLVSHCHIDHCADLGSLYIVRKWGPRTAARLPVVGPSVALERLMQIDGTRTPDPLLEQFEISSWAADSFELGPFTVTSAPMAHPVETFAIRLDAGGRSLTYSGDTGPTPRLDGLARETDLALFEASVVGPNTIPDLHLSGAEAAQAATAAGAGRLLLTHLVGWNDDADVLAEGREHFDGPVDLAFAGMIVDV